MVDRQRRGHPCACVRLIRSWRAVSLLLLLAAVFSLPVQAGTIHPALRDQLEKLGPGETATGIMFLSEQADIPALNEALKARHATRVERHREVVTALQEVASRTQPAVLSALQDLTAQGKVTRYTPYWIANLIVVRGDLAAFQSLAALSTVSTIEPDGRISLIEPVKNEPAGGPRGIGVTPGLRAIRAPEVWSQLGINGAGALIGGLDTGVDGNHPALHDRWRGNNGHPWQECWLDVLGTGTQTPNDGYGHGTHTMGTMTGLGAATNDTVGVAWGAQWIACNAINQGVGSGFDSDIVASFQWFTDPDGNPNTVDDVPDVVQNSWGINEGFGGTPPYTDCDTRWWAVIDNCEAASVCVTWSAGNEGPGAQTLRSPGDRATTAYNCFSVGAVDATHSGWPYPIASWSSRGPTGCNVPAPLKIKPEVSAPGVDVYSSVPGGGYGLMSGTSMAGPHVAGVVALMRSANPDVDVDTIKQILMDTARDEGTAGEDNNYGWGCIDAYEAVIRCLTGYGTLAGNVTNASNGGSAVPGASIRLVEISRTFTSDGTGHYSGMAPAGTYTAEVSHPSFATITLPGISMTSGQTTTQDFALTDIVGPVISGVTYAQSSPSPDQPFPIGATITDFSAVALAELIWRVDGGPWTTVGMTSVGPNQYQGLIPNQPVGAHIEFYLHATDSASNGSFSPADAPNTLYDIFVVQAFFYDDFETDRGWSIFQIGDTSFGRWVRYDPWGTQSNGVQCEPADDHTGGGGTMCMDTGQGTQGGTADASDVDFGCVTLTSPTIDLSGAQAAFVDYWRWWAREGAQDGLFVAQASSNGGATWNTLEILGATQNSWTEANFNLSGVIAFTDQVKFRFIACDTGDASIVEAAIDDFTITGIPDPTTSAPPAVPVAGTVLYENRPNPFGGETNLGFRLGSAGSASLVIYDPAGRLVRTLVSGPLGAGEHSARWDGRDDAGNAVGAGVYFYELRTDGGTMQRKMMMLK